MTKGKGRAHVHNPGGSMSVLGLWRLGQSVSGVSLGSGIRMPWRVGIFLCEDSIGAYVARCQVVCLSPLGRP